MALFTSIPVSGFAIRLLGDPHAWASIGDLAALASDYPTLRLAHRPFQRIMEALAFEEIPGPRETSDIIARLVFQAVFPGHGAVTRTEIRAFRREDRIVWAHGCFESEPATIRIMADFFHAYCWGEDGCQTSIDLAFPDIPGIEALHEEFDSWQEAFDLAEWQPTLPMLPGFDWASFHERGLVLASRLKLLLGDRAQVIYEKPGEDPDDGVEGMRLMVIGEPVEEASRY